MKKTLLLSACALLLLAACTQQSGPPRQSGSSISMEEWAAYRSWPDGRLSSAHISRALAQRQALLNFRGPNLEWEALGPKNIGGRTISLAFHPLDSQILFVGSAGGGLWKTTTMGVGPNAWQRVNTGFPVIGVGAIAINPLNPDEMYIGTGEVYNYTAAQPSVGSRLTRGSYGIGILKSTDGGLTWAPSLDWTLTDMRGVWDIVINPENPSTVWAATTEGIFRSYDSGQNWSLIHNKKMGVDLELNPIDTNILWVTHGGYLSPDAGVFRSNDSGTTWAPAEGLPNNYTGRALLAISPYNPMVMYVSIANAEVGLGLYRSNNGGQTWVLASNKDVASYQGWYSHDVAIVPEDPTTVLFVGIDVHKSTQSGATPARKTYWYKWTFGQTPVGGPEGPFDYVHADIHAVYFSPFHSHVAFAVTDGGVFYSSDAGESWEGRNGGFQSQQFYANLSSSISDSSFAIGGMQDNATAIYVGDDAWVRVIGGDGMGTAIRADDDNLVFGSYQSLALQKSEDRGNSFTGINTGTWNNEARNFNSPFELVNAQPGLIYAGAQRLHKSLNWGDSWQATTAAPIDNGNPILTIAVDPDDPNTIFAGTAPLMSNPRVLKSTDGGQSWQYIEGLPDRTPMDIVFDPEDSEIVYAVFSGFNTEHVFRSIDGGQTWTSIDNGLPDVPTNTLLIDPQYPDHLYVGNDVGLYVSLNGGETWAPHGIGPDGAVMVMHLSLSPANDKIRIATHGLGVYQIDLADEPVTGVSPSPAVMQLLPLNPNPASNASTASWEIARQAAKGRLALYDLQGKLIKVVQQGTWAPGRHQCEIPVSGLAKGVYLVCLEAQGKRLVQRLVKW